MYRIVYGTTTKLRVDVYYFIVQELITVGVRGNDLPG